MARPRSIHKVPTRNVGAAIPVSDADRLFDLCAQNGTTQAEIVKTAVYAFLADHVDAPTAQEVLPLREAG